MAKDRSWIQTYTGKRFWPLSPEKGEICIEDVAWALSNMPRFTGHTSRFYSVAEHSIMVARLCPPRLKLAGLLHDASEAYLCDIASPVKHHPEFEFYRRTEKTLQAQIYETLGVGELEEFEVSIIKYQDVKTTAMEAFYLMSPLDPEFLEWVKEYGPFAKDESPLPMGAPRQEDMYKDFLMWYNWNRELTA